MICASLPLECISRTRTDPGRCFVHGSLASIARASRGDNGRHPRHSPSSPTAWIPAGWSTAGPRRTSAFAGGQPPAGGVPRDVAEGPATAATKAISILAARLPSCMERSSQRAEFQTTPSGRKHKRGRAALGWRRRHEAGVRPATHSVAKAGVRVLVRDTPIADCRAGLKAGRIAAMRRQTRARSATRLATSGASIVPAPGPHSCCAGILRGVRIAPASAKNVRTPYVRHGPTVGADNRAKPAAATGVRPAIGLRAVACSTWARLTASTASLPRPAGRGALSRSTISSLSTGCVLGLG